MLPTHFADNLYTFSKTGQKREATLESFQKHFADASEKAHNTQLLRDHFLTTYKTPQDEFRIQYNLFVEQKKELLKSKNYMQYVLLNPPENKQVTERIQGEAIAIHTIYANPMLM